MQKKDKARKKKNKRLEKNTNEKYCWSFL